MGLSGSIKTKKEYREWDRNDVFTTRGDYCIFVEKWESLRLFKIVRDAKLASSEKKRVMHCQLYTVQL